MCVAGVHEFEMHSVIVYLKYTFKHFFSCFSALRLGKVMGILHNIENIHMLNFQYCMSRKKIHVHYDNKSRIIEKNTQIFELFGL